MHAAEDSDPLGAARARWAAAAPDRYTYVVEEHAGRVFGICRGPGGHEFSARQVKVTVHEGRVVRIASIQDNEFPADCLKGHDIYARGLHTIAGLFAFVEREQAENGGSASMHNRYDPQYGFPTRVSERNVLDGSEYSVSEFRVLK